MPLSQAKVGRDVVEDLHIYFADAMRDVDELIQLYLHAHTTTIPQIGKYVFDAGGKRLRPLLVLAGANMCGAITPVHIKFAAAVELMHTATLLHDDVVDDSTQRRGRPAARLKWGNSASVLVGDFLLGQAFKLMVDGGNLLALKMLSQAAAIIAEGEVMQLSAMGKTHMNKDYYLQVIEAKTAELFSVSVALGSLTLANPKTATTDALANYGRNLGIAFQLMDDALDYDDTAILGKNAGDDFREGKITLPIILAYQRGNEQERRFWRAAVTNPHDNMAKLPQAIAYIRKHGALKAAQERAVHYATIAQEALHLFPDTPSRSHLLALARFAITRRR